MIGDATLPSGIGISVPENIDQAYALLADLPDPQTRIALAEYPSPIRNLDHASLVAQYAPSARTEAYFLYDNTLQSIEMLSGLASLEVLYLSETGVTDLSVLKDLLNLRFIIMPDNERVDWRERRRSEGWV